MAQWPDRLAKGKVYDQPVVSLDIFATASVAAGGFPTSKDKRKLDGVNLIPFLTHKTKAAPHEKLFWRQDRRAALRMGNWKLLRNPRRGQSDEWRLYNLATDIAEQNNLANENSTKREELLSTWRELNAEMVEPIWQRK
jgi:arylsulfatase B